jgi:hypothetical protein
VVAQGVRGVSVLGTALLAVLVFVVGQYVLRFVFEPIQEQRKVIGDIAHALLFYANVYEIKTLPPQQDEARRDEIAQAMGALRDLAARLRASIWTIPFYDALALLGRVPKKTDVLEASAALVGWSNGLYGSRGTELRIKPQQVIDDRLGISKKIGEVGADQHP